MRETWLSENQRLVSQDNFGFDLAAVEAAAKKHEAIETDIFAYEERVQAVVAVSQELEAENYHDIERINARKDNVLRLWNYLLELLRARRMRLEMSLQLQQNFQVRMGKFSIIIIKRQDYAPGARFLCMSLFISLIYVLNINFSSPSCRK
jgi:Spectrin repeat